MAATAWTRTNNARLRMAKGDWNVDTATLKCALFLSTSNLSASSTTYAGLTNQHANANGYTTGGVSVDLAFAGTTSVTVSFVANPSWTASGGNVVARFAVIYEVSGDVYAYCTLDSTPADVTRTPPDVLTIDSDGSPNPIFTVT